MVYRRRKYAPKRSLIRRKRLARKPRRRQPSTGGFYIRRRYAMISMAASNSVAGLVASTNTNVLVLGTPVSSPTNATGYYDIPFAIQIQLDQAQNYTDVTNIADKYRIMGTQLKFILNQNTTQAGLPLPFIEMVRDHDDAAPPTIAEVTQKMGVVTRTFVKNGTVSTKVYPLPAPQLYNGVSAGYSVLRRSPYINSTYYSVPHYCLKGIIRNFYVPGTSAGASTLNLDINLGIHAKDLQ